MTLIGLLILLLFAGFIAWLAATYLPPPFGWIIVAVVVVVLLIVLVNGVDAGAGLRLR